MKSHNMSKFGSTQELYTRIGSQLEKINNQPVGVEEFEVLLNDTRELYERALVLRYKAFEKYKSGDRSIVQDLSQLESLDLGNQEGQLEIDLTKSLPFQRMQNNSSLLKKSLDSSLLRLERFLTKKRRIRSHLFQNLFLSTRHMNLKKSSLK
jgi:hypothetical protein